MDNIEELKSQLKAKEQECERLKEEVSLLKESNLKLQPIEDVHSLEKCYLQQLDQLKAELKSAKELREYTYDCCKRAGKELAKNSFEWDGKEKNLVVQAMELNERYDQLKVANERLKNTVMLKCPQCGEVYLDPIGVKLYATLTEIKEIAEILAPKTDEYENCLDRDRCFECDFTEDCSYFNIKQILQKISECEVEDVPSD